MTNARMLTFEALVAASQPLTVVELAKILSNVDRVSVYRCVDLFESIGIVHRVWAGLKSKIELSEIFSAHHHHFNCIVCGHTASIKSIELENSLHNLETEQGFELRQHSIELSGFCKKCKSRSENN